MNMPAESSKGELGVVLPQKYGKHDWRGKGNCMCSSHKLSKMLLGIGFKTLFKGRNDSTTRWNITHPPPPPKKKKGTKKHQITKSTLGEAPQLLLKVNSKHMHLTHTMACYCQHVAGHTCFIRWHEQLVCQQQQNLFIIIFKCNGHPASKEIQSVNQNVYVRMKTSIMCCI